MKAKKEVAAHSAAGRGGWGSFHGRGAVSLDEGRPFPAFFPGRRRKARPGKRFLQYYKKAITQLRAFVLLTVQF